MSRINESNISGLFEVTDILDYDPVRKEVYFMSTENPNLKPNEDEDPKLRRDFKFSALILLADYKSRRKYKNLDKKYVFNENH